MSERDSATRITTASVYFRLLALAWLVMVAPLALPLLIVATTWTGREFAVAALWIAVAPLLGVNAWESGRRCRGVYALLLGLGWLALTVHLYWRSPTGVVATDSKVRHLSFPKGVHFTRARLANLLPEVDQLMLGFILMPLADPLLTTAQASRLKTHTASIYSELEKDAEFRELGTVMPLAYDEILDGRKESGHAYLYVPSGVDRTKPAPAIVFFHGSGGNFKAYLWLLSQVADRCGAIVIAPSFGLGGWTEPTTLRCYDEALVEASRIVSVDRGNIHVMGLSNGGLAVSQLANNRGSRFRSLVFLSPVFDSDSLRESSFGQQCAGRSLLVISGRLDDRVPDDYVKQEVAVMKKGGANVTLRFIEDADHFALFSHREQVTRQLGEWLGANGATPRPVP